MFFKNFAIRAGPGRVQFLLLALVAVLGFVVNLGTARSFEAAGLLSQDDVLFNADSETYHLEFVWGGGDFNRGWGGRTYKHPNLTNFVNPPVRVLAAVLSKAGLWQSHGDTRRALALCVSPVASLLATFALFGGLRRLGWGPTITLLICLLDVVCFSRVLYGSLPESFALCGLAIALIFLLAARGLRDERPPPFYQWAIVGTFAVGVTIINLIPLVLLYFTARRTAERSLPARALATLKLTGVVVLGTVLLAIPMTRFYRAATGEAGTAKGESAPPSIARNIGRGIQRDVGHYHGIQWGHLALYPLAVVSSLVPPEPAVTHLGPLDEDARISYLPRVKELWPIGIAAGIGLALLAARARRIPEAWPISSACLALLAAYGVMHLFYGDELFLYALHWQVPLLVVIGAVAAGARSARLGVAALVVLIAIAAVRSAHVIPLMLRQWEAVQGG